MTNSNSKDINFIGYLDKLLNANVITQKHKDAILLFITEVNKITSRRIENIPSLQAGPVPETGSFMLVWNNAPHHFSIEVYEDSVFEWFYKNREKKEMEAKEDLDINTENILAIKSYFENISVKA